MLQQAQLRRCMDALEDGPVDKDAWLLFLRHEAAFTCICPSCGLYRPPCSLDEALAWCRLHDVLQGAQQAL